MDGWLLDESVVIVHGSGMRDEFVIGQNVGLILAWNTWVSVIWKGAKVTPFNDG